MNPLIILITNMHTAINIFKLITFLYSYSYKQMDNIKNLLKLNDNLKEPKLYYFITIYFSLYLF